MIRRAFLVAFASLALADVARASDKGDKKDKKEGEGKETGKTDVDMSPIAIPIVVGGQLRNYVFVTLRLAPTAAADTGKMRQKEPFLRDLVVRMTHRTSFGRADNYNMIDEARLTAAVMAQAPAIVGAGQLKAVVVAEQRPKNLLRMPKISPAPGAAPK